MNKRPSCQFCKAPNLRWQQVKGGRWKVFDTHNNPHECVEMILDRLNR